MQHQLDKFNTRQAKMQCNVANIGKAEKLEAMTVVMMQKALGKSGEPVLD